MALSLELIAAATEFVRLPELGIGPVAFDMGFFKLRWYSLGYLFGIMLAYWLRVNMPMIWCC
jgi:phosphatidylglycerol---prolipoprotein diacylglyceryl transferase